jgi:hypothetical protein
LRKEKPMATGKIHYEIHIKPAKGKWKMAGVMQSRDAAIRHGLIQKD